MGEHERLMHRAVCSCGWTSRWARTKTWPRVRHFLHRWWSDAG